MVRQTTLGDGGILDETGALGRRDPRGMLAAIGGLPEQISQAWQLTRELRLNETHRAVRAVAVVGMGGSAVAGDIARGVFADRLRVPVVSVRDYELPAWVDRQTLVVAASHSGSTEETISAVSAALERRCPVVVITTGGALGEVAGRVELPRLIYPDQSPPRAALGYGLTLLCGLLERAGLLELADAEIEASMAAVRAVTETSGPAAPTQSSIGKQLAWALLDRLPVIEGSGFLAPVARRWKAQLNENGKSMAVAEELPEATHNTVVGYAQPDHLHDHLYVVFLASALDHPRSALRAAVSSELLAAAGIGYQVVPVAGEGRLAEAWSAIALGDYVSTYLALLYGVDPSPVEAISHVKERLLAVDVEGEE